MSNGCGYKREAVQVLFAKDCGSEIWLNADIVAIYEHNIRVKYQDKIPNYNESLSFISKTDISSKIRRPIVAQKH